MTNDCRRRTWIEVCEHRCCLSIVAFEPHTIECCGRFEAHTVLAADLDGDGDSDVLSASSRDHTIAWYENEQSQGAFGPRRVISANVRDANSVHAGDLDGDGDLDVLSTSLSRNEIAWHENTNGQGTFAAPRIITTDVDGPTSLHIADLDADGDLDLLSASQNDNKIAWYENTNGQAMMGPQRVITTKAAGGISVYAADLDGDGDLDVLSASPRDDKVAWYENIDGNGEFGDQQVITTDAAGAASVKTGDLDGDGDLDVLSASFDDDTVAWYENRDGGNFGRPRVITTHAGGVADVFTVDMDGDGDLDVVSASYRDDEIAWHENVDGSGEFAERQIISAQADGARSVHAIDLDTDGDIDVLWAAFSVGKITWNENRLTGDSNDDGFFDSSDLVAVFQQGEYQDDVAGNSTFDNGDWNLDGEFDSSDLAFAFEAGHYEAAAPRLENQVAAAVDALHAQEDDARI